MIAVFFIGLLALFPICSADADDRWISESTALQTKILKKNSGKVPFPFEDFDRFKVGYENLKVLIPNGRSLQKKSTDLKHPRIINAMGEEIFLGYSPKSKSVEIISLNETELRFDFYEVKNYESGKTLIPTRANTALCFSCHQHEGPIFSRFPWSEAAHPGGQLMDKVVEKYPGVQKYHGAYLVAPYYSSSFQAAPAKIDIAIRHANQRLQTLKACAAICKNDYACKKVVMKALLEKMAGPENPKTVEELKKYVIPVWPSDGFQYASSILPSRKPFDGSFGKNGSIERIYDRSGGEITVTVDGKPGGLNSDDIRVITESYKIDGIGDPKVKRPFIGKIEPSDAARFIYKNSGVCFHLGSDEYSLEGGFSSLTDDERSKILNDEGIIGLLKREAWPGRKETIFALFKAKNVSAEIQQKYENEDSAPSDRIGYQIKEQPAVDAKYQKVSKLFKKYCVSCHCGENSISDLPLENLRALREYPISEDESVIKYLEDMIMPPRDSKTPQPSRRERRQMIQKLLDAK